MTGPVVTNHASGDSDVGVQAGVVHGDVHFYQAPPQASPAEVFQVGIRYLAARMPAQAREHIERAVAGGLDTDQVQFYRLLALLSGRTLRQLDTGGFDSLTAICARIGHPRGDGPWAAGLRAVLGLLGSLSSTDTSLVDKELGALPPAQRELIVDHLGVLLDGPMEDGMWQRSVELARARRTGHDRAKRVWAFFHPEPARPRLVPVKPAAHRLGDLARLGIGAITLYGAGSIGTSVARQGEPLPVAAFVIAVIGAVTFLRYGAVWNFRRQRIRMKDAELVAAPRARPAPPGGFARGVDNLFDRYFGRYVPKDVDRDVWIAQTSGIRQRLRDELVELYREQGIPAKRIAWLVRFLVSDVRSGWERNTLTSYRRELRAPARIWGPTLAGLAAMLTGSVALLAAAPVGARLWTAGALITGTIATRGGFRIAGERQRVRADTEESWSQFRARQDAYERWKKKLSVKPSDAEMADWLEADRRLLVDHAMAHYRLRASQIIAHAVIEGPANSTKRARVKHGPWRYSRYRLLLFLLTGDGVRQITVDLEFEAITGQIAQRLNYRFDAVASVRVDGVATQRQTFELTLINGLPVSIPVTEALGAIEPGESAAQLSEAALDASGLPRTLDVLEGIAAEGKEWVRHQRQRTEAPVDNLVRAVGELLDGHVPARDIA